MSGMAPEIAHESFGTVSFNRLSSSKALSLFGSSIRHNDIIVLRVNHALLSRDLHSDSYRPTGPAIVEVYLSYTQFAEMMTSFGVHSGVPCTLTRIGNKSLAEVPDEVNVMEKFQDEFDRQITSVTDNLQEGISVVEDILNKKTISMADRKIISNVLKKVHGGLKSNTPFIQRCWTEQLHKTTAEAKGNLEAFVSSKVNQLGLAAIRQQFGELEESSPSTVSQLEPFPYQETIIPAPPEAPACPGTGTDDLMAQLYPATLDIPVVPVATPEPVDFSEEQNAAPSLADLHVTPAMERIVQKLAEGHRLMSMTSSRGNNSWFHLVDRTKGVSLNRLRVNVDTLYKLCQLKLLVRTPASGIGNFYYDITDLGKAWLDTRR